jgi:Uma2 family endonuclease
MNIALTHTAEELPRHRTFTAREVRRLVEIGVLSENERVELIEGNLVVMAAKGVAHERIKNALNMAIVRAAPRGFVVGIENTLQLAEDVLVEPDIAVMASDIYKGEPGSIMQPRPQDVLLLIEVALSSMGYDRNIKARLYARHGIREYWVIDANTRITWIHTGPSDDEWSSTTKIGPEEYLTTSSLPDFAIKLGEID